MENNNTTVGRRNTKVFSEAILSRVALGGGAVMIAGATGYMNIAGWVAQANDKTGAWVNGILAGGMELGAAGALAWAAYQIGQRRPLRAVFAGAVGGVLVYFNTLAAQNFIHVQLDTGAANVASAALHADDAASAIARHARELAAIERRYGDAPPRPITALDAAAHGLDETRPRDARMLRRLREERASRVAYDIAQAEIDRLRDAKRGEHMTAAREIRTVMPPDQLAPFIWAMEALKGSIFFILGTSDLSAVFRRRTVAPAQGAQAAFTHTAPPEPASDPAPAAPPKPKQSPADRARWARVKGSGRRAPA